MFQAPLYLLDKALPLLRVVSSCTGALLPPDDDEAGEPTPFGEEPFGHEVFALRDHLELCIVNELDLLIHAVLVALADNSDDEVHKDNVADNQNEEPEEPCQDLEVSSALYD